MVKRNLETLFLNSSANNKTGEMAKSEGEGKEGWHWRCWSLLVWDFGNNVNLRSCNLTGYGTEGEPTCLLAYRTHRMAFECFSIDGNSFRANQTRTWEIDRKRKSVGQRSHRSKKRLVEPMNGWKHPVATSIEKRCRFASDFKIRHGHQEIRSKDSQGHARCVVSKDDGPETYDGVKSVAWRFASCLLFAFTKLWSCWLFKGVSRTVLPLPLKRHSVSQCPKHRELAYILSCCCRDSSWCGWQVWLCTSKDNPWPSKSTWQSQQQRLRAMLGDVGSPFLSTWALFYWCCQILTILCTYVVNYKASLSMFWGSMLPIGRVHVLKFRRCNQPFCKGQSYKYMCMYASFCTPLLTWNLLHLLLSSARMAMPRLACAQQGRLFCFRIAPCGQVQFANNEQQQEEYICGISNLTYSRAFWYICWMLTSCWKWRMPIAEGAARMAR